MQAKAAYIPAKVPRTRDFVAKLVATVFPPTVYILIFPGQPVGRGESCDARVYSSHYKKDTGGGVPAPCL